VPSSKKHTPKAVLDANVWVSALLWGGKPAEIIKASEQGKVRLVASEVILREISQVLNYPKLRKVYEAEGMNHEELIEAVLKVVQFVQVTRRVKVVLEHPADDKFLECALEAKADYVVSGDKHLLRVGNYEKIQVVSVREFLEILANR
jgi:putative PIN family toxin of toxin-antitoxin system